MQNKRIKVFQKKKKIKKKSLIYYFMEYLNGTREKSIEIYAFAYIFFLS